MIRQRHDAHSVETRHTSKIVGSVVHVSAWRKARVHMKIVVVPCHSDVP